MHIRIILSVLVIFCVLLKPTIGISRLLNSDLIYFPDQAEYIQKADKCPDNLILWPGTGKCYKEGERGPCDVGRVILLDKRLLKPYCKDIL